MSLRDKIAQLMFVRIGSNLPPIRTVEAGRRADCAAAGSLPDRRAAVVQRRAGNEGLARSGCSRRRSVPLLVASDIERGVGQQVRGYTLFPHAMAFEKLGPDAAAVVAEFARSIAQEARDVGIHITFGPVADVNTNPRNPIIATRAFSEDPERAAELTRGVRRGSRSGRALHDGQALSRPRRHAPGFARFAASGGAVARRAAACVSSCRFKRRSTPVARS